MSQRRLQIGLVCSNCRIGAIYLHLDVFRIANSDATAQLIAQLFFQNIDCRHDSVGYKCERAWVASKPSEARDSFTYFVFESLLLRNLKEVTSLKLFEKLWLQKTLRAAVVHTTERHKPLTGKRCIERLPKFLEICGVHLFESNLD